MKRPLAFGSLLAMTAWSLLVWGIVGSFWKLYSNRHEKYVAKIVCEATVTAFGTDGLQVLREVSSHNLHDFSIERSVPQFVWRGNLWVSLKDFWRAAFGPRGLYELRVYESQPQVALNAVANAALVTMEKLNQEFDRQATEYLEKLKQRDPMAYRREMLSPRCFPMTGFMLCERPTTAVPYKKPLVFELGLLAAGGILLARYYGLFQEVVLPFVRTET